MGNIPPDAHNSMNHIWIVSVAITIKMTFVAEHFMDAVHVLDNGDIQQFYNCLVVRLYAPSSCGARAYTTIYEEPSGLTQNQALKIAYNEQK